MRQIVQLNKKKFGEHTPRPPTRNLNPHHYRAIYAPSKVYVIFDEKKEKPPYFYISLASGGGGGGGGGYCPQTSPVKYDCIYFCTNVRIWIDLGEKYGTKFSLLIYYSKNC